ncbi:MAG: hypothetical protein N4Q32_03455, partial [Neisseriaceae bacterium]|nr:hypothetical protein [Neisseriaceae bacterium]
LDLQPGRLKLKQGGSNGGHNGLKDIDAKLGSNNYYRLRVGIGHPRDNIKHNNQADLSMFGLKMPSSFKAKKPEVTQYVLKKPSKEDQAQIEHAMDKITDNLDSILDLDLEVAQRHLHYL